MGSVKNLKTSFDVPPTINYRRRGNSAVLYRILHVRNEAAFVKLNPCVNNKSASLAKR